MTEQLGGPARAHAEHLDRFGRTHAERPVTVTASERLQRVAGRLERSWSDPARRDDLRQSALAAGNPVREGDVWTWVVEAPDAQAVLLFLNAAFDHEDPAASELARLADSGLWTISLRVPGDLISSYRIAVTTAGMPPWRVPGGRREVLLTARAAGRIDPRGTDTIRLHDGLWSVAGGHPGPTTEIAESQLTDVSLPSGHQAWMYAPRDQDAETPLLVMFDGQRWRDAGLAPILDAAIRDGTIPPIHAALLDSGDHDQRWRHLGVPGGQVDTVLDELLPRVRERWNVSPAQTIACGQSFGGLAALWLLALGQGEVQHAIAQSPSLWRFDLADAVAGAPAWRSIAIRAGRYERDMVGNAEQFAARLPGRDVRVTAVAGGHDWARWRADLIPELAQVLGA